jgi:CheY-like chemotaxis protein
MSRHAPFVQDVLECLGRLHDIPYLDTHRLATLVERGRGSALQRALMDAIEELRPPAKSFQTAASPAWRQHRYLQLRYVEGSSRVNAIAQLGISARQASRDQDQALRRVADLLWNRYAREQPATAMRPSTTASTATFEAELSQIVAAEESNIDLVSTIESVVATVQPLARNQRVRVECDLSDTLPPVAISRTLLRQGLINLLSYVIETRPGATLLIDATDTPRGVGLTLRARRGRGRPLARLSGHESPSTEELLEAGRRLLQAARVRVDINWARDGELLLDVVLPTVPRQNVLVIDDNPDVIGLFRRYLRGTDFRVLQAGTARQALSLACEVQPCAITLDLMMPGVDGWEILQQLRADPLTQGIPIIVCSALPEGDLARSHGVVAFLAKPVTAGGLLSALERSARQKGEHRGFLADNASSRPP